MTKTPSSRAWKNLPKSAAIQRWKFPTHTVFDIILNTSPISQQVESESLEYALNTVQLTDSEGSPKFKT